MKSKNPGYWILPNHKVVEIEDHATHAVKYGGTLGLSKEKQERLSKLDPVIDREEILKEVMDSGCIRIRRNGISVSVEGKGIFDRLWIIRNFLQREEIASFRSSLKIGDPFLFKVEIISFPEFMGV